MTTKLTLAAEASAMVDAALELHGPDAPALLRRLHDATLHVLRNVPVMERAPVADERVAALLDGHDQATARRRLKRSVAVIRLALTALEEA